MKTFKQTLALRESGGTVGPELGVILVSLLSRTWLREMGNTAEA